MIPKVFYGFLVFGFNVQVVQRILEASSYQEFQREVINLFGSVLVKSPVSIVEALDQSVPD